jgi:hypothetical protein
MGKPQCPICEDDSRISKITAIIANQTSTEVTRSSGSVSTSFGDVLAGSRYRSYSTSSTSMSSRQSYLASLLAAPTPPDLRPHPSARVFSCLLFLAIPAPIGAYLAGELTQMRVSSLGAEPAGPAKVAAAVVFAVLAGLSWLVWKRVGPALLRDRSRIQQRHREFVQHYQYASVSGCATWSARFGSCDGPT